MKCAGAAFDGLVSLIDRYMDDVNHFAAVIKGYKLRYSVERVPFV